jgi:transposase
VSKLDHMLEPETATVHRLEVISGTGRRRRFSDEFKARVVEETLAPKAVVSQIARRHGLSPQQVFTWRRQARVSASGRTEAMPRFVPAVIDGEPAIAIAASARSNQRCRARATESSGMIAVEIAGTVVRVSRGADAQTVAAVIAALKSTI